MQALSKSARMQALSKSANWVAVGLLALANLALVLAGLCFMYDTFFRTPALVWKANDIKDFHT
jgi:hypothetical protein